MTKLLATFVLVSMASMVQGAPNPGPFVDSSEAHGVKVVPGLTEPYTRKAELDNRVSRTTKAKRSAEAKPIFLGNLPRTPGSPGVDTEVIGGGPLALGLGGISRMFGVNRSTRPRPPFSNRSRGAALRNKILRIFRFKREVEPQPVFFRKATDA